MDEPAGHLVTGSIDVQRVSVTLDGAAILRDISLTVAAGEWLTIIGPNGSGKTTLLRAVAGLVPARGAVDVAGLDPGKAARRAVARALAYVPQDPLIPGGMTVLDYVLLGRTAHLPYLGVESRHDLDVVHDALGRLDLHCLTGRDVTTLSGGEQQRVVLARALAQQADVLVLDEPTSALDVGHQQQVLELVESIRVERALAVVSAMHDLTLAGQFADRLLMLAGGRVVACGTAREVLTEDALSEHWGARVRVVNDPDEGIVVIPLRRRTTWAGVRHP